MSDPCASLLIFVYQTRSTEVLAAQLTETLNQESSVEHTALAYHAQMSAQQRQAVQQQVRSGHCRCLVTTSALSLGVNLPATHVIVRDTTYLGLRKLSAAELLQMMGRAGRGNQTGHAFAIVRENDSWNPVELADQLRHEVVDDLTSSHSQAVRQS